MNAELEEKVRAKYALLTDEEILDLLVNRKWYATIFEGIKALYVTTSHQMTNRIVELVERYEDTLPELSAAVADYESKVKAHLKGWDLYGKCSKWKKWTIGELISRTKTTIQTGPLEQCLAQVNLWIMGFQSFQFVRFEKDSFG